MNKNILILMIFMSLTSCTSCGGPPPPPPTPPCDGTCLPKKVQIYVTTENYKITKNRLLTTIKPCEIQNTVISRNGSVIYFETKMLSPCDNCFLLAQGKPLKSGTQELVANRICDKLGFDVLPPPRDEIKIYIVIKNLKVFSNRIENSGTETFGLYREKSEDVHTSNGIIAVIKSKYYPDEVWKFLYPMENGDFTITAKRQ